MIRISYIFYFLSAFALVSCVDDFGSKTVTYTKATAIYGDLDALRNQALKGAAREIDNPGKIFVYNDLILVGEEGHGIHVIDNSNPNTPKPLSFINIPGNREYFVQGGYLYAESVYDMVKIDLHDKNNPVLLSRLENAFAPTIYNNNGDAVVGFDFELVTEKLDLDDEIFEYATEDNIYYYDFSNTLIPPSAVPASFAGNSGSDIGSVNRIVAYDGYVYAVSRQKMHVFEAEGFTQIFNESMGWDMETVYPMGDRLFVGGSTSVDIYDISERSSPSFLTSYFHMTSCDPVLPIDESTAYVTLRTGDFSQCPGDENSLLVIDISNSDFVNEVQQFNMSSPFGMSLIQDLLYVGEGKNGLKIFDARDRRNLKLVSTDRTVEAYDVLVHPVHSYILLIASPKGLEQHRVGLNQELQFISNIEF